MWNRANDTQIGITAKLVAYMFTTSYHTLQQAHKGSNRITRKEYTICRCWPIAYTTLAFRQTLDTQSQKYSHLTQYPNCSQEISTIRSCSMFANSPRFTKYSLYISQNPVSQVSNKENQVRERGQKSVRLRYHSHLGADDT